MVVRFSRSFDESGQQVTGPEQISSVRQTVDILTRLLSLLYPESNSLDIITVEDVIRRYPLTGLGAPALSAIEQSQRILRGRGEFDQVGLGEFHVGLIYLYWNDTRAAANQFSLARQPWSLANDSTAICLAHYAQGLALYHAYHNESAMMQFSRAERLLNRTPSGPQAERFKQLATALRPLLTISQETLRHSMWPEEQVPDAAKSGYLSVPPRASKAAETLAGRSFEGSGRTADQPPIPRPISNLPGGESDVLRGPVPGHIVLDDRYGWYIVAEKSGDFLPQVAVGTWVLGERDPEEHVVSGREYVIVGSRQEDLGSILVQPVSHSSAVPFCYLGYREQSQAGELDAGDSRLYLNEAALQAASSEVLVVAVVEGLWFGINGQAS
jgi:hypothetical protein